MQILKFSKKNVGRAVLVNGMARTIGQVAADGSTFRVKEELESAGSTVEDYTMNEIEECEGLIISICLSE